MIGSQLMAQNKGKLKAEKGDRFQDVQMRSQDSRSSSKYASEKKSFIAKLNNDVEPNLVKGDITRLNRNVMRLGSYHADWAKKGEDFLVANAPLAELYLYRYASLSNQRLNKEIISTLLRFKKYRYPRAALVFLDSLAKTPEQKILALQLLRKVILQNPQIGSEAIHYVSGDWGFDVPLNQKLGLAVDVCSVLPSSKTSLRGVFDLWMQSTQNIWDVVTANELRDCYNNI
jgi:hypothetical protein